MKLIRSLLILVIILLALIGLYSIISKIDKDEPEVIVSQAVLLERVEKVYKLVTIEGSFSEIYNYQHHYFADIWPFRKKALVRINAKVLVGYHLDNMILTMDEETRTISLNIDQEPEILAIDHDVDYYNFENGLFNVITNEDITDISSRAKESIREKAEESDLFEQAEQQKEDFIEILRITVESAGWNLVDQKKPILN